MWYYTLQANNPIIMANRSEPEQQGAEWSSPDIAEVGATKKESPVPAIADITKKDIYGTIEGETSSDLVDKVVQFEKEVFDKAKNETQPDPEILAKALKARIEAATELAAKNAEKMQKIANFWERQLVRLRKGGKALYQGGRGVGKGALEIAGGVWDFSWELFGRAWHGVIRGFKKGRKKTDEQLKD